jgi:MFS family permease
MHRLPEISMAPPSPPTRASASAWFAVALCGCAYLLSNVDRQIIALLVKPIEADLQLSDTQFGLLQGLAFALLYATMGIPIATAADRGARPAIMSLGVAVWSLATMACGGVRSFGQILLTRATVGVGEAALSPASYSLISDIFPRNQLNKATALYSLGSFLGTTCAFLLGGALIAMLGDDARHLIFGHAFHSWQIIFLLVGLPGLPLAAAIALCIPEPRRHGQAQRTRERATFAETVAWIGKHRALFIPHLVGYPLYATALYVLLGWSPAFLIRVLGFTTSQAGSWLGFCSLLASGTGLLLAGAVGDRLFAGGRLAAPFEIGVAGALGIALTMIALALAQSREACLAALALGLFFAALPMAPSITIIQIAVPPAMRSRVSALLLFANNLIGFASGNFAVGWLNDHALGGPTGVRLSLPIVVGVAATLAIPLLLAGRQPLARRIRVITETT